MKMVLLSIMFLCLAEVYSIGNKHCEAQRVCYYSDMLQIESNFTLKINYGIENFADCVVASSVCKTKKTDADEMGKIYDRKESNGFVVAIGFYDNIERKLWKTFFHDVWIENGGKKYLIKKVQSGIWEEHTTTALSSDGNCVLLYHEYEAPYGYDEEYEQIEKYDLSKLPQISKTSIGIDNCCKLWLIGKLLYYTQELIGGIESYDDYSYSFSCLCIDKTDNRKTIAKGFECVSVSSDGKYALGYMYLYGKRIVAMLKTETSKLCLYKGINSLGDHTTYDEARQLFGIDCGNCIKYISIPSDFPYSALEYKPTLPQENKLFWSKYEDLFKCE